MLSAASTAALWKGQPRIGAPGDGDESGCGPSDQLDLHGWPHVLGHGGAHPTGPRTTPCQPLTRMIRSPAQRATGMPGRCKCAHIVGLPYSASRGRVRRRRRARRCRRRGSRCSWCPTARVSTAPTTGAPSRCAGGDLHAVHGQCPADRYDPEPIGLYRLCSEKKKATAFFKTGRFVVPGVLLAQPVQLIAFACTQRAFRLPGTPVQGHH
jgi:hypothetical protein